MHEIDDEKGLITFLFTFLSKKRRVESADPLLFLLNKSARIWQLLFLSCLRKSINVVIDSSIIRRNEPDGILDPATSSFFSSTSQSIKKKIKHFN